jgi:carbamate kinase
MGPKVVAACEFAKSTGKSAAIGGLTDVAEMIVGERGTIVSTSVPDIEHR